MNELIALLQGMRLPACQMPERSGLPSASRGAGAVRFGFPSFVRGIPSVGHLNHCANVVTDTMTISAAAIPPVLPLQPVPPIVPLLPTRTLQALVVFFALGAD